MKAYHLTAAAAATLVFASATAAPTFSAAQAEPNGAAKRAATVPGWPSYVAMGAVGGPNISAPTATSRGGDDDFGGRPVDVVFKYAGANGNGDPGIIDPPTNALRMTGDLTTLSNINSRAMRVAIVEYTAQMSGGVSLADFSNTSYPDQGSGGSYLMARHLISLAADSKVLDDQPVVYDGQNHYGTLVMNPDLLGAIQQGNHIEAANNAFGANSVNNAVDQAMCFMTRERTYTNTSNPNGLSSPAYLNKTYTGTPVDILEQMLADGYPVWSINSASDPYWNTATDNLIGGSGVNYSQIGQWFNSCVSNPKYNAQKYQRPEFPDSFEGWVQANNWLIRTFSRRGHVTFGWQDNMWAVGSGFWLHAELSNAAVAGVYSTPVSSWLNQNAPSAIKAGALGKSYAPDYFAFDRYETDDSSAPGQATLYNARSWDHYLTAVGQVSKNFNKIPIMLWQIPGSHIPYKGEANPELYNNTAGKYVFSTAPDYFFGDSNLKSSLNNMVVGPTSATDANTAVGNFMLNCSMYNCPSGTTYKEYLTYYRGRLNNYDWSQDNGNLAKAAANGVFSILWGGGNTTNVIKNFSNPDDHGWLAGKIVDYYQNPTPVTAGAQPAQANGAN